MTTRRRMDLTDMTQAKWDRMTTAEQKEARNYSGLTPQLIGLEGWRVEVETTYGTTRRFIVGRSSGWIPCHLEMRTTRSAGGMAAESTYRRITKIEKVR